MLSLSKLFRHKEEPIKSGQSNTALLALMKTIERMIALHKREATCEFVPYEHLIKPIDDDTFFIKQQLMAREIATRFGIPPFLLKEPTGD